jgi:hypothetical protein
VSTSKEYLVEGAGCSVFKKVARLSHILRSNLKSQEQHIILGV